jgi:hypothetical protein
MPDLRPRLIDANDVSELSATFHPVKWTKNTPTDTGWYWFRANGGEIQIVVDVSLHEGQLVCVIPQVNFHGRMAAFENQLKDFNALRRRCELKEIKNPEWSDQRVPIPK